MQSGVLTDSTPEAGVVPVAPATELVSTPAATSSVPPCPVAAEVCELAVELLPAIQAGDGRTIAVRAVTQHVSCPAADGHLIFAGNSSQPLCDGHTPTTFFDLYQLFNGKGILYYADIGEFADTISDGLGYLGPSRLLAVGCLSSEGQPDCARGALAVYASPEPTPATPTTPTPFPPDATPIDLGLAKKPAGDGVLPRPDLVGLVFSRGEVGEWRVETFMAKQSVEAYPIVDGTQSWIYSDEIWPEITLMEYAIR
jgi:hypothetical protein